MTAAAPEHCVLVVDDEPDVRDALCELVEMGGCASLAAANGAEALDLLARRKPCLVILDLLMPIMSGVELLERMRLEPGLEAVPVVISTSAPSLAPPGVPVVKKPVDIEAVWSCMRRSCSCATARV